MLTTGYRVRFRNSHSLARRATGLLYASLEIFTSRLRNIRLTYFSQLPPNLDLHTTSDKYITGSDSVKSIRQTASTPAFRFAGATAFPTDSVNIRGKWSS